MVKVDLEEQECRYIVNCCIEDTRGEVLTDERLIKLARKCGYVLEDGTARRVDGKSDKKYMHLFGRNIPL